MNRNPQKLGHWGYLRLLSWPTQVTQTQILVLRSTVRSLRGFLGDSDGKEAACSAGDPGLIPGLGSSPGEGKGDPLQYSGLENPMDREAWWARVHGVTERRTRLRD